MKKSYYSWKTFFAYRAQAVIWSVFSLLHVFVTVLIITVLYQVSPGIAGWSYYQVLLLSSLGGIAFYMIYYFFDPSYVASTLRNGGIDAELTRPVSKFAVIVTSNSSVWSLITIIENLVVLVYAALHVQITIISLLSSIALFVLGTITLLLFLLMLALISYHVFKEGNFVGRVLTFAQDAGNYPLPVYGTIGQLAFSLALPIGLAFYYPSQILFGELSLSSFILIILACIVIGIITYKSFNFLLSRYTSGGG